MNNKPKTILNCLECKKEFQTYPYMIKEGNGKYCSRECSMKNNKTKIKKGQRLSPITEFKKGLVPWNKGMAGFGRWFKVSLIGVENPSWKGDKVGYFGLHNWVYSHKGQPSCCEHCHKEKKRFVWANKSREYNRDIDDWISLCDSCHHKYDLTWLKRVRDTKGRFS